MQQSSISKQIPNIIFLVPQIQQNSICASTSSQLSDQINETVKFQAQVQIRGLLEIVLVRLKCSK
jgi:hypothetical protein